MPKSHTLNVMFAIMYNEKPLFIQHKRLKYIMRNVFLIKLIFDIDCYCYWYWSWASSSCFIFLCSASHISMFMFHIASIAHHTSHASTIHNHYPTSASSSSFWLLFLCWIAVSVRLRLQADCKLQLQLQCKLQRSLSYSSRRSQLQFK